MFLEGTSDADLGRGWGFSHHNQRETADLKHTLSPNMKLCRGFRMESGTLHIIFYLHNRASMAMENYLLTPSIILDLQAASEHAGAGGLFVRHPKSANQVRTFKPVMLRQAMEPCCRPVW